MPAKGYAQITGIAWSGGGKITRVEISTDGGKNWRDAKIQDPVHTRAHTRFTYDWDWNGQEAVIQSRATDDQREVQPTLGDLSKLWGITMDEWRQKDNKPRAIHMNAQQPWKVNKDGSISDALFA